MLRAGFTEVLVTGMLMRWMMSARPITMGAKPTGARMFVVPRRHCAEMAIRIIPELVSWLYGEPPYVLLRKQEPSSAR